VQIEDAARGPGGQERHVQPGRISRKLQPVQAPAHVTPAEVAQEAMPDAVALQRRDCRVSGRAFEAFDELEPAQPQRVPRTAQISQPEKALLQEEARLRPSVRGPVDRSQPQRPCGRRRGGMGRQSGQPRCRELDLPVLPAAALRRREAQ
jgi:hypothetical protein